MNNDEQQLLDIIKEIHIGCFKLCKEAYGEYLPIAGNIGVFCQSEEQYKEFYGAAKEITKPSNNPDQKYFELKNPIIIPTNNDLPEATYSWLYIRKPADDSPEAGDVDFILSPEEYEEFKQKVAHEEIENAHIYERPGWDMVEVKNPNISAVAYITTKEMAEKVRVRF